MNKKAPKVAIIDYQMSNLFSVKHACAFVGLNAFVTSEGAAIKKADAAILPGTGAFGEAMINLKKLNLIPEIKDFINSGRPFMGICLGLQLLFTGSEEFGFHPGLDIIKGRVKRFPSGSFQGRVIKIPQIGWNRISKPVRMQQNLWKTSPLGDIRDGTFMYFVHSYFVIPSDRNIVLTRTNYEGVDYCSGIMKGNIFAVQFHPEKSAQEGIKIYYNWANNILNKAI